MASIRRAGCAAVAVFATFLLSACSAGKSGESGGGLAVSPGSLTLTRIDGAVAPNGQDLVVTINASDAAYVIAGAPAGTTAPPWLALSLSGSGRSWRVHVSITDAVMAPGTYTATVRVAVARSDQSLIAFRDVSVTYTVRPGLAARPSSVSIRKDLGSSYSYETAWVDVAGTAGYAFTASADQPWILLSAWNGTVPTRLDVGVDETGIGLGSHEGRITFLGGPEPSTVDVLLTLTPPTFNGLNAIELSGTAGVGTLATPNWLTLEVGTNAYPWTATNVPAWLRVSPASGTMSSDWQAVSFGVDAASLPPGQYAATVEITVDVLGTPITKPVTVTCTLAEPALTVPASLALGGVTGHDLSAVPAAIRLATGSTPFGFTASSPASWARVSPVAGSVSGTPVTLTVSPDPAAVAALPAGTYTSAVEVTADVNGAAITRSVPLTLTLDDHVLLVGEDGVAFTSLPGTSVLSRSIRIRSNRGAVTGWSAASDASWLSVTPAGTTDDDLVLAANPAGLAQDALYEATVTVSPTDANVVGTRRIRVGLWNGSTVPAAVSVPIAYSDIAADPVRPRLYATDGGADVTVYDVFTGAVVRTLAGVGTALRAMAVSGDGARLFVHDEGRQAIVAVDLATGAAAAPWPLGAAAAPVMLAHARPNGTSVLLASDGVVRDATTGADVGRAPGDLFTVARSGTRYCSGGPACYGLDRAGAGGEVLRGPLQGAGGAHIDVALDGDGSRVYGAGYDRAVSVFDVPASGPLAYVGALPASGSLTGTATVCAIEVGADGRVYVAGFGWYDPEDLWVFDAAGNPVAAHRVAGRSQTVLRRQLAVSGDGLRMMVLTDDPTLQFLSTSP